MTAGNNGNPENDDPFGYLYRHEGGEGDAAGAVQGAPAAQPGVPRTSHHQVTRVGERQYGGQQQTQQQGGYGYPPQAPPQQPYQPQHQQPAAQHYAAPPANGGGGGGRRGGSNGGGPNSRGLLIGSIAVLAAVSIGIGVAVANGSDDETDTVAKPSASVTSPTSSSSAGTTAPSASATQEASDEPLVDAATLPRAGGAEISDEYSGANAADGKYVDGMGTVGASVTWAFNAPAKGSYDLWLRYANAEKDAASATVATNGTALGWKIDLQNYGKEGDWTGWYRSFVTVDLKKGANSIAVTCGQGDVCHFNLDQIAVVAEGGTKPFE